MLKRMSPSQAKSCMVTKKEIKTVEEDERPNWCALKL